MTLPEMKAILRSRGSCLSGRLPAVFLMLCALVLAPVLPACSRTPVSSRVVVGTWVAFAQATPRATPGVSAVGRAASPGPGAAPAIAAAGTPVVEDVQPEPPGTPSATIILASPQAGSRISATLAANVGPDGQAVDPTTTFSPTSPKVYVVFTTEGLQPDSHLEAVWIAEQVQIQVPSNYEITRSSITVQGDQVGNFSLVKPNPGFPLGRYRVDLFLNGALIGQFPFTVRAIATPQPQPATPQPSATATSPAG